MSHYLEHLSYISISVVCLFVFSSPKRNQDLSKNTQYKKVLLILEAELGHTEYLQDKGTDTFTLQPSTACCSDSGTQNPCTIRAEKFSAQAWDSTRISSCLELTKTAKERSAATAPAGGPWGIYPTGRNRSPCLRLQYLVELVTKAKYLLGE